MYHYISPLPTNADELRIGLTIQPEIFRQQLGYLQNAGYKSVSLYDLQYALGLGWSLPDKPVIFTFDDGYRGLYEYALPIMQEFGYTGTVFLLTQLMDEQHPAYLSWEMAHLMATAGWHLEPHGKTHVQLVGINRDKIVFEVLGSMQTIEAHVGYKPRFFSYPSGHYDDKLIGILQEIGFWGSVTTETEIYHDLAQPFQWGRIRIDGRQNMIQFQRSISE